jgi:hypothetical protein
MVLPTKLRNHNELKKRRNKKAVPLSEVNLLIYPNVTGNLKENQQKVSGKGCLANISTGMV